MPAKKVLIVNACGSVEGDVAMLLLGARYVDHRRCQILAASVPRGDVYERLKELAAEPPLALEKGGIEAVEPGRKATGLRRAAVASGAVLRLVRHVRRERIAALLVIDRTIATPIAQLVAQMSGVPLVLSA
ncbi:MAG TPA: hypothetical protein VNK05_01590, partial [Chloroflexota bacterium]|nr:hypothetical protein [Chloroflexota bacterium]